MESMGALKRTHNCNELGPDHLGKECVLMGWVLRRRDHGGVSEDLRWKATRKGSAAGWHRRFGLGAKGELDFPNNLNLIMNGRTNQCR